jgi:hypothetical protein
MMTGGFSFSIPLIPIVGVLAGAAIVTPGPLWFLQGAAIIEMRPILCVADCEPVVGGSPFWAAAGAVHPKGLMSQE